ncbi:hypothetical protein PENSTE_c019G04753 [Penicillium steckii]|uniref:SMP domain-containing protein n=1 Tax=Penicillium steckii TaxID=303698 RepID=A0A1V6SVB9_9EURO|nr:hypothetical protein PENSTE_c019G04753 [Penicillium steckii]
MDQADAARIQAANAKAGKDMNGFPARAQAAADKNVKAESASSTYSSKESTTSNGGIKKSPASSVSDRK